jgi:hypothetical protein
MISLGVAFIAGVVTGWVIFIVAGIIAIAGEQSRREEKR